MEYIREYSQEELDLWRRDAAEAGVALPKSDEALRKYLTQAAIHDTFAD